MTGNRIRLAFAFAFAFVVASLGIALSTGTATAQISGCGFSVCDDADVGPSDEEVTTTTTLQDTSPATVTTPGGPSLALTEPTSQPTLPFTGGDIIGLTVIGAAALGAGTVLVRRTRSRRTS